MTSVFVKPAQGKETNQKYQKWETQKKSLQFLGDMLNLESSKALYFIVFANECIILFYFRIPPTAKEQDIFHDWHVCYHGTKPGDLCSIIECGRLIKPGI
jgi:hypothetical protein